MGHENCSDMLKKATLDNKDREGTLEKQPDDLLFLLNTFISPVFLCCSSHSILFFVGTTSMLSSGPTDQRHHKNEKSHKKQLLYV